MLTIIFSLLFSSFTQLSELSVVPPKADQLFKPFKSFNHPASPDSFKSF
jgi:hypothetical protein